MTSVILSETQQQKLHSLESNMDVILVPVDASSPLQQQVPSADYSSLDNQQVSAIQQLEGELGCILLAVEHK